MERQITYLKKPVEIKENIYIVHHEMPHRSSSNVYLLHDREPTLIDCGSRDSFGMIVANLDQLQLKPRDIKNILLTHGHMDHYEGVDEFRRHNDEVAVYIHEGDVEAVTTGDPLLTGSVIYERDPRSIEINKDYVLSDEDEIDLGDFKLTVHHTPGHTQGSACYLATRSNEERVLFGGDAVFGGLVPGRNMERDLADWRQSNAKLADLNFKEIYNGHHDNPISKKEFIQKTRHFGKELSPWFDLPIT